MQITFNEITNNKYVQIYLTKEELDTEQYEQEVNESGYNEEGRDEVTGY